jgi:hypothetical protein
MIQANLLGVLGTQEIIIIRVREFNDAKNNVRKEIEDNVNNVSSGVNETKTPS